MKAFSGPLSRRVLLAGASAITLSLFVLHGLDDAAARPLGGPPGATAAPTVAADTATAEAQQAAAIARQSQGTLTRATQAIQAMQAAQAAARAAAAAATSNIADGLSVGGNGKLPGLVVDPRVGTTPGLWINADLPTQSASNGKTTVTIKQNAAQAVMTWAYYNVSPDTTVVYDQQGNPSWVALNRIDATGTPSQILGQIKADGTVLIINPNGIIFGAGAQINVHSLIASSLDIDGTTSSSVFNTVAAYNKISLNIDGLGDVAAYAPPNEVAANQNFIGSEAGQGLFTIAPPTTGATTGYAAGFAMGTIDGQLPGATGSGAIVVQKGAFIETSVNSTGDGGYAALLGSKVTNSGSITTKNGQIILAAQGTVSLAEPLSTATGVNTAITVGISTGTINTNAVTSPASSYWGSVINDGLLSAPSGNVTASGGTIQQLAVLAATTSVNRPGSINLSATDGSVVFGPDSVTAILPDEESGAVPTGTATADYFTSSLQPKITISGGTAGGTGVDFQPGSLLRAPSAAVNLIGADVLLESGATIDVSGLADVRVPISNFLVTILVTPNEIADSPLAAALIGKSVTIDTRLSGTRSDGLAWIGSPIVDASGYAKLIPKSIEEVLTVGGSVSVSGTNFIQKPGSIVDLSGGYVTYTGSAVSTTRLIGADGRFYDIGSADYQIRYVGVTAGSGFTVDHGRWGVTETYVNPLLSRAPYEPSYIAGASAGSLSIASAPILAGTIFGETVTGLRQRANAQGGGTAVQTSLAQLPAGASLTITSANASVSSYLLESSADAGEDPYGLSSYSYGSSWRAPSVMPVLTDRLSETGFASITIQGSGTNQPTVNMATGAVLQVAPGGSVTLANVESIDGSIIAPAGKIALTGHVYSSDLGPKLNTPDLVIGSHALLDVHGLWINDAGAVGEQLQGSAFVNAGSVSITTLSAAFQLAIHGKNNVDETQSIILSPGSVIDVSSGGYVGSNGKLKLGSDGLPIGKGGSLSLVTYSGVWRNGDSNGAYYGAPTAGNQPNTATVVLDGTIYSNGFGAGGTFTLQAPTITIDGQTSAPLSYMSGERSGEIVLPASFFTDNGFSNYSLTSVYGSSTVTAGTTVLLRQANYLASNEALLSLPTGAVLRNVATVGLAPDGLRNPVSFALQENGYIYGGTGPSTTAGTLLDTGARIIAEANASKQATVTLTAAGPVTILGEIIAPGGDIVLANTGIDYGDSGATQTVAPKQLTIGADAVLDVSGVYVPDPTQTAYRTGSALDAGTITLYGFSVTAQEGSRFLLDGTSAEVEIPSGAGLLGPSVVTQKIWSDGGVLQIGVNQISTLNFAGSVSAHGGAELANGGLFRIGIPAANVPSILSGRGLSASSGFLGAPGSIYVEPAGAVGAALASNTPFQGGAFVGVDTLMGSGFDTIELNALTTVAFVGSQSIQVRGSLILGGDLTLLPASGGDPLTNSASSIGHTRVDLAAGYVQLGQISTGISLPAATASDGSINISAQWIDIGNPSYGGADTGATVNFRNAGTVTLASADAIRLMGYNRATDNAFTGSLGAGGDLTLKAAEIYPTSGTSFTLKAGGAITIEQTGVATQPLSAGGAIIVDAKNIVQNGTLWAPFGQITLGNKTTTQSVTLGADSLTSVSGAGMVVPYGYTVDGEVWYVGNTNYTVQRDGSGSYQGSSLTSSPTKAITLNGADVATSAGARVDLSGGGDFYASEFVAGVGGSRNVLAGSAVYALVPTSSAKVAAYDPTFAYTQGGAVFNSSLLNAAAGSAIYIPGGNGIAAGYYTLMPGMYATLPGAYRVTVASTSVKSAATQSYASMDGSLYVTGNFANVISGTRSSQTVLFQLQSQSTWSQYSQIDITSGARFIRDRALTAGTAIPASPLDGGALTFAARNSLSLDPGSSFGFAAGSSPLAPDIVGVGGQLAISAAKILVLGAEDSAVPTGSSGYLKLYADQLDNVGATTLLIGGASTVDSSGNLVVTGVATDVEIANDAEHPLSAPQLLIVTKTGGDGVRVDDGAAISAVGTAPSSGERAIAISGDGSLLRVSTGAMVSVTRSNATAQNGSILIGTAPGTSTLVDAAIAKGVTIDGVAALTIDSSGVNRIGAATLIAKAFDLAAKAIDFGGASASGGLALTDANIANFAGADLLRLRSASAFDFHDAGGLSIGDAAHPIAQIVFDGGGFYSEGGETSVYASNITLTNTQNASTTANGLSGSDGKLNFIASETITQSAGTMTANGFGTITLQAGKSIRFVGSGALTAGNGAGVADVVLSSPNVIAVSGSTQALTTSGALAIRSTGAAAPVDVTEIGGSLSLTAASILDSGTITALAGSLSLTATKGDVTLADGAQVNAAGSRIVLGYSTQYAPGGAVKLVSQAGNVRIASGAKVDVSAAKNPDGSLGPGYAGSVSITTANTGTTTLQGTLDGSAKYKDTGGSFVLSTGTLVGDLPWGGFTRRFGVSLYQPSDIIVPEGVTLNSLEVLLVANRGSVVVGGTIDASGPASGGVALYGAGTNTTAAADPGATGVIIRSSARLDTHYVAASADDPGYANGESALNQRGGTITLGTTGATDGTVNATYGYQNVSGSGAITVESGAVFDVRGGPGGEGVDNTGGAVMVRAPILTNDNVNVSFRGTVVTNADANGNASGQGVVLDAFAVWSTTDSCPLISGGCGAITSVAEYNGLTAAQQAQMQRHFDGIIDPAGFFNGSGARIISATSGLYPNSTYASSASGAYLPHVGFYQNTLLNFVQNPFSGNAAAVAANFAGAKLQIGDKPAAPLPASSLHLRPEIDLVNPSAGVNGGNVTVASNWNLGAGVYNTATSAFNLFYRTTNGGEPGVLTLRAVNNIQVNATISDGFYETSDPFFAAAVASGLNSRNPSLAEAASSYAQYSTYGTSDYMPGMTSIAVPPSSFPSSYNQLEKNTWYALYYYDYSSSLLSKINSIGGGASSLYITTNASGSGTFDNDPTHYSSYAAYVAAYNANYVGSRYVTGVAGVPDQATQTFTTPASSVNGVTQNLTNFDNNPAHYQSYAAYASAYQAYAAKMGGYITSYYAQYSQAPANSGVDPRTYPSTILAPIPPAYGSVYAGGAIETAAQFSTDYQTYYAGTAYNSWNLYYWGRTNKVEPGGVNGDATNTVGKTALWLGVMPYLPTVAETPEIVLAGSAAAGPGNAIANNPANNVTTNDLGASVTIANYNTTSVATLMPVSFGASSSYDFVAGAYFGAGGASSVDPNATVARSGAVDPKAPTASIVIDGHTSYADPIAPTKTVYIPTLVRTGTGSITLSAAGNVQFTDPVVQGAVYTAGAAATTPADYTAPILSSSYNANPNGLISTPAWGTGGGSIIVSAGGSIIGVAATTVQELWSDWFFHLGKSDGDSTPFSGCSVAGSAACQTSAWVNYASFFQNFGALGGGDITLRAGGDITDVAASIPETLIVAGGFTAADPPHAIYYGGGNLLVQAGGDLNSSAFLVGRGSGRIEVGGSVKQTVDNPITSAKDAAPYPLLLAVEEGYVSVAAKGDLTLGTLLDPASESFERSGAYIPFLMNNVETYLPGTTATTNTWGTPFTSYGARAGLSLSTLAGNVNAMTLRVNNTSSSSPAGTINSSTLLPPRLDIAALRGSISVDSTGVRTILAYPTDSNGHDTAGLSLAAAGSILITNSLTVGAPNVTVIGRDRNSFPGIPGVYINPLGYSFYTLAPSELTNSETVQISAGVNLDGSLTVERPAQILVGRDIGSSDLGGLSGFTFTGLNFTDADVTSVVAGRDITGRYYLYGPGALLIEAGRNIRKPLGRVTGGAFGVVTYGNGSGGGTATLKSYLPEEGADIYMLYGIANGVDYAAAISHYIDPAAAGTTGIDFLSFIAQSLGQSREEAWTTFQTLDATHQHLLVDKAFLQFLTQVATDYRNASSSYYLKYARAYEAIGTLFPKGLGYANDGSGGADRAAIGQLVMPFSLVETQMGGDINIIGPNGGIRVGSAGRDTLKPNQEGLLTLRGGAIRIYTDQSVLVNQSRIMTQQGGNVEIFSGNGDINAGSGPKTYVSNPALSQVCLYLSGYCAVNPQGLVTGAGIGAIVTLPTQDPSLSNAFLSAPHGTVDLGAAGVRAAGNLTIVAQRVTNAYNVQAGGTVSGLATVTTGPNVGALTSASSQAGAAAKAVDTPQAGAGGSDAPSIITVEVLGYGGSDRAPESE
ncbi:filamentous hemagglutinin N-terminal domain-containing protein [Methylosinus sporium]|uniref:Filamentous hemagglutinin N-terminal domain-containing protein n=1 Tax=Methylosinus sporium TaxID=428 RepID=A0A549T6B6_METSR|nr:filamentous haemagglutinin family protein [Methylosinus sporium]TRL37411.1 filamentous hemagglutinin N-terminal domain-containing protein [Methylosinus sporium]